MAAAHISGSVLIVAIGILAAIKLLVVTFLVLTEIPKGAVLFLA